MTDTTTPADATFEYLEMTVGIAHRPTGPTNFRRTLTEHGAELAIGREVGSPMAALNAMGAQGWRVVREHPISAEQHPWVEAELQEAEREIVSVSSTREYLLMRVRRA